jgi:Leucine-rich repeat (LRR) protein
LVAVLAAVLFAAPVASAQTDELDAQAIDNDVNSDRVGLVDPVTGQWHIRGLKGAVASFFYGNPGDVPFMGDWNCDGVSTPGLYRQSDGFVYLRNSNSQGVANIRFFFGNPGDYPLAGDFDGDGCDTVSIYRASESRIYLINELGANDGGLGAADTNYVFGNPGDKPFVGDFDGDGEDTVGLHRESTGFVYFRNSHTQGVANAQFFFGDPGDRLVAGDWGIIDGVDTPAVFRPSNTTFFFRHTNTQGNADESLVWGQSNFLPVAGSWTVSGGGGGGNPPPVPPQAFCATTSGIHKPDCEVLINFYNATGGPNWINRTGWGVDTTPCSGWFGVLCQGTRVSSIIMEQTPNDPGNGLSGVVPASLGNLAGLRILDLASGELSGNIPASLGNLTNLQGLDLSGNLLSGAIPSSLGNLSNLSVELDLHNNLLTGGLPSSFQNLTSLDILDLGGNLLSNTASLSVLGQMTALTQIDLRNNGFTGLVPGEIGSLPILLRLDLSHENNIGGWNGLEAGFGDSQSLADLDMSGNNFTNAVFSEVTTITSLTELDLSFNNISGSIPGTIGQLFGLTDLDLSANSLSGAVPTEIMNLTNIDPFGVGEEGALKLCPNGALTTAAAPDPIQVFVNARDSSWVNTSCSA